MFGVAGRMFNAGAKVDLARINDCGEDTRVIVDLPNYIGLSIQSMQSTRLTGLPTASAISGSREL